MQRKAYTYTFFLCFLFFVANLQTFATGLYRVFVTQSKFNDSIYSVQIFVQANSTQSTALGSSNFAFKLNSTALQLSKAYLYKPEEASFSAQKDPSSYLSIALGAGTDFINVSTFQITSGTGKGILIAQTPMLLATVHVPILNKCAQSQFVWYTQPTAVNNFQKSSIKTLFEYETGDPLFSLGYPYFDVSISAQSLRICDGEFTTLHSKIPVPFVWLHNDLFWKSGIDSVQTSKIGKYKAEVKVCTKNPLFSNEIQIDRLPNVEKPEIVAVGNVLTTNKSLPNQQWFFNGSPVGDLGAQSFQAKEAGSYQVSASNACNDAKSDPFVFKPFTSSSKTLVSSVSFSPNPFTQKALLTLQIEKESDLKIELYNVDGMKVNQLVEEKKQSGTYLFTMDAGKMNLQAGLYIIKVITKDQVQSVAIVHQK